jgi:hypothetical protein
MLQGGFFILRAVSLDRYMDGPLPNGDALFNALVSYDLGDPEKKAPVDIPYSVV